MKTVRNRPLQADEEQEMSLGNQDSAWEQDSE